jgi:hypothetical protein
MLDFVERLLNGEKGLGNGTVLSGILRHLLLQVKLCHDLLEVAGVGFLQDRSWMAKKLGKRKALNTK